MKGDVGRAATEGSFDEKEKGGNGFEELLAK